MSSDIRTRSGWDRFRYAILFEAFIVIGMGVALALLSDEPLLSTGGLGLLLSIIALLVNLVYNYAFDRVDVAYGRIPTERSRRGRIVHAVLFETVLVVLSLPVIMLWMQWGWWHALTFDIVAMAAVVVYTYAFTLAYDFLFPVPQEYTTGTPAKFP